METQARICPDCGDDHLSSQLCRGAERLKFNYTNYRGETRLRNVEPQDIWFGKNKYHPEKQWFLRAYDTDKKAWRDFSFKDIVFLTGEISTR